MITLVPYDGNLIPIKKETVMSVLNAIEFHPAVHCIDIHYSPPQLLFQCKKWKKLIS